MEADVLGEADSPGEDAGVDRRRGSEDEGGGEQQQTAVPTPEQDLAETAVTTGSSEPATEWRGSETLEEPHVLRQVCVAASLNLFLPDLDFALSSSLFYRCDFVHRFF